MNINRGGSCDDDDEDEDEDGGHEPQLSMSWNYSLVRNVALRSEL